MKLFFALFLIYSSVQAEVAAKSKAKIVVAYFGRSSEEDFDTKLKPVFIETARCKDCEIVNWTPYDKDKKYDDSKLIDKIGQVDESVQIIFFDWNDKSTAHPEELIEKLGKLRSRQQMVVASAGAPAGEEKTCPLNLTIFGKIEGAVIIGELIQKDILWPKCYFGPEMLTAVRPPKEHAGKGLGPLIFTARFAGSFNKRTPEEWTQFFRAKKAKSRKIWPEMEDFFPR